MDNKEILLTKEGYDKIVEELDYLKAVKRAEVAERIKIAISFGDISENAEYDEAKNEQAQMEERIYKLENQLRVARIIEDDEIDYDTVTVGASVKIEVKDSSMKKASVEEYTIVGSTEADPSMDRISNESPIGSALLGKKVGDKVTVQIPMGTAKIKILEIAR
ncbi:MAG: transcription elongation factor GreA [Peptostreptococcaceae bacterium]|nr:transcription elongation factor GreA [Peptostreptococcaceae bacterium]